MSIPDRGGAGSTTDAVTTVTTVGYGDTFPLTLTAERGTPVVRTRRSMPDFDSLTVTQTAPPPHRTPSRARWEGGGGCPIGSLPKCRTRIGIPPRWVARRRVGPAKAFGFELPADLITFRSGRPS